MKNISLRRLFIFSIILQVAALNASEYYTVFTAWLKNPLQMGEMLPLSQTVCKEITYFVKTVQANNSKRGCYYLDAGAGSGVVSAAIVHQLRPCDHLDLVEIDPKLCEFLRKRFAKHANVHVHCCSILDFKSVHKYDAILSTLPFNSFSLEFAQKTMKHFKEMSNAGGVTTYVELSIVRKFLKYFYHEKKKRAFVEIQGYFKSLRSKYLKRYKTVYLNFTPVDVYHLEL